MRIPSAEPTIPQAVLDAALALHQRESKDLTFGPFGNADEEPAESNPLWRCVDGQIEFANLEARNHCAALATFQQMMPLSRADALFEAAYQLWRHEIGHSDLASGRLLGLACQSVNVLWEAARAIKAQQHHKLDVFDYLHLVEAGLPHISDIDAGDVVALIDAQYESTKRDMARGMIFSAIESRLRSAPSLAWEIWRIARGRMSEAMQNLYGTALQALMHTDQQTLVLEKAREDAQHLDPLIAGAALWTLGRAIQVLQLNEPELSSCIAVLTDKTIAASSEIQQAAIRAVAHAALKDERLMSELVRQASVPDDHTLAAVAYFLFINQRDFPVSSPYYKSLLGSLISLSPTRKDAIDHFDWVLQGLYSTPEHRPLVMDCLRMWVIQHGDSNLHEKPLIELFDHHANCERQARVAGVHHTVVGCTGKATRGGLFWPDPSLEYQGHEVAGVFSRSAGYLRSAGFQVSSSSAAWVCHFRGTAVVVDAIVAANEQCPRAEFRVGVLVVG
ncbi:MAG: hypothetical protein Q8S32_07925 [Burkholderiaceae bacterium]|nr:hypothetical protein [Burkholderiaceae bacterium]